MIWCSPYAIYFTELYVPSMNTTICIITNVVYLNYLTRIYAPFIVVSVPFSLKIIFVVLVYRTVPLVRCQHEVQITRMILIQTFISVSLVLPHFIFYILTNNIQFTNDSVTFAKIQLVLAIALWLNNEYFVVNLLLIHIMMFHFVYQNDIVNSLFM